MHSRLAPLAATAAALAVAFGSGSPALADTKIGYFDVKRVLGEIDDAKAAKAKLQREFDDKQKKLDEAKIELEKLGKEFEQKAPVLSNSAKEQMQVELQTKAVQAQRLYVELQGDLAEKERQALGDVFQRLEPVVREVADKDGYGFVFEKNESGLFLGPAAHDLTPQVIRRYNERFPPKKSAAPPAAAKADKK
jgi:outer membrane protein